MEQRQELNTKAKDDTVQQRFIVTLLSIDVISPLILFKNQQSKLVYFSYCNSIFDIFLNIAISVKQKSKGTTIWQPSPIKSNNVQVPAIMCFVIQQLQHLPANTNTTITTNIIQQMALMFDVQYLIIFEISIFPFSLFNELSFISLNQYCLKTSYSTVLMLQLSNKVQVSCTLMKFIILAAEQEIYTIKLKVKRSQPIGVRMRLIKIRSIYSILLIASLSAITNTQRFIRIGQTIAMNLERILQYKNLLLYDNQLSL